MYEEVIKENLKEINTFKGVNDPNDLIDKKIGSKEIEWYPTYLFIAKKMFYMFRQFSYADYLSDEEFKNEYKKAQYLIKCLKDVKIYPKIFFITKTCKDVERLKKLKIKLKISNDFGIFHGELEKPIIDFLISSSFEIKCKLLPQVLVYLATCKNLKGKVGKHIRVFSKNYLEKKPATKKEEKMITEFLEEILICDKRLKTDSGSVKILKETERIIHAIKGNTRDHFFHAFNTMMIGFMIIDKFYNQFSDLIKKYGKNIILEHVWLFVSIHHDIGYPFTKQSDFLEQTSGLDSSNEIAKNVAKQYRQKLWDGSDYNLIVDMLDDLFTCIKNGKGKSWIYSGFPKPDKTTNFRRAMKNAFVEKNAHGVVGAILLGIHTVKNIKKIKSFSSRQFLCKHIMIASLSILFHDQRVRESFMSVSIKEIDADKFFISNLLTYVDIIQDDRRSLSGCIGWSDLFKDVYSIGDEGKIIAKLDNNILKNNPMIRQRFRDEINDAFKFFKMKKLKFILPKELKA